VSALGLIFSDEELAAFLRDRLYPLAGLPDVQVERAIGLAKARDALRAVIGNAGLLLHRDGRAQDEVHQYYERYAVRTPQEVAKAMQFIQNPLFRSYIFNYTTGKALLAPLLEGPDATANFRRLLSEPFTPTQIRRWLAERGASPPS
jgi:cytochrome P450